jgi:hypothetical protein
MEKKSKIVTTLLFVAFILLGGAVPGWPIASTGPWNYTSPTDSILGYESLATANEATELAFANSVLSFLGMGSTELTNGTGMKYTVPLPTPSSIVYSPGFSWDYAVVKVDGPNDYSYLFMDDNSSGNLLNGDDILTTPLAGTFPFNLGSPALGISHITFLGGTTLVPEPLTLILLGFGIVGLAGLRRRLKK